MFGAETDETLPDFCYFSIVHWVRPERKFMNATKHDLDIVIAWMAVMNIIQIIWVSQMASVITRKLGKGGKK